MKMGAVSSFETCKLITSQRGASNMACIRDLDTSHALREHGLIQSAICVGFVVDKVALE